MVSDGTTAILMGSVEETSLTIGMFVLRYVSGTLTENILFVKKRLNNTVKRPVTGRVISQINSNEFCNTHQV